MKKLITTVLFYIFATPFCLHAATKLQPHKYDSALAAQKDFHNAVNSKSREALIKIFGSDARSLIYTSDEIADKQRLEDLSQLMKEKYDLVSDGASKMFLEIGKEGWIFPVPILETKGKWSFNLEDGREEILNRLIGENEISAIKVARFFVEAQKLYYSEDRDGNGIREYAAKIISSEGKKDGLYWPFKPDGDVSPFQPVIARAASEGYVKSPGNFPFYKGYYFKNLPSQVCAANSNSKTCTYDYKDQQGRITGGYALIAYPINWGTTGIQSFIVNQDGVVFEKNLGKNTSQLVAGIKAFNPQADWIDVAQNRGVSRGTDSKTWKIVEDRDGTWGESKIKAQKALSYIVSSAVSPGKFDDVVELLDIQTRDRIGKFRHEKYPALKSQQEEFQKSWKNKYGTDFCFDKGLSVGGSGQESSIFDYSFSISPDGKHFMVSISDLSNSKAGKLELIFEKFDKKLIAEGWARAQWRIKPPQIISGPELREKIMQEVTALNAQKDSWPENEVEGYKFVAKKILPIFSIN